MTFWSEVAVRIGSCGRKFHRGFALVFSSAEIFSEGGARVFLGSSEEAEMGKGVVEPSNQNPLKPAVMVSSCKAVPAHSVEDPG